MEYIYMDNFRGFSRTVCPISRVNFFVGENSTGKSSILSLIEVLSNYGISSRIVELLQQSFGSFNDMVSAGSVNRDEFTIGYFGIDKTKSGNYFPRCCLYQFCDDEGIPQLLRYAQTANGIDMRFTFDDESASYYLEKIVLEADNTPESAIEYCEQYIDKALTQNKPYKTIQMPSSIRDPFFVVYAIHRQLSDGENPDDKLLAIDPFIDHVEFKLPPVSSSDPIRSAPKKYYDAQNAFDGGGDNSAYITLNKMVKGKDQRSKAMIKRLEEFGRKSGLFDTITTHSFDRHGAAGPFEVTVSYSDAEVNIKDVGYGVSQALPLLMKCILVMDRDCIAIQQPEVHLHPRAQASFGDLLFSTFSAFDAFCLVETHSDFIIDRYRLAVKRADTAPSSQVVFCEKDGPFNKLTAIPIQEDGSYPPDLPESYRAFFVNEALDMLGI